MTRQDAAFYTYAHDAEQVWPEEGQARFYVIRNGEMRIHYSPDADTEIVIRYTDQLEAIGCKSDEDLQRFSELGDREFDWVNNPWFEVIDSKCPEIDFDAVHTLDDAIAIANDLYRIYGEDKEVSLNGGIE